MIINHNMAAMNTHRQLGSNNAAAANNIEKLSSGLKINRAGDDAAGLAISEKMRGQIRGLDMAQKNSQDGISLIQTAEGSLNETHDILQRMRELAVQAGNDTNTGSDRKEIQKEINSLTSEVNRIGNTTEFNTQKLLDGSKDVNTGPTAPAAAVAEKLGKATLTLSASGSQNVTVAGKTINVSGATNISGVATKAVAELNKDKELTEKYTITTSGNAIVFTQKTDHGSATAPAGMTVAAGDSGSEKVFAVASKDKGDSMQFQIGANQNQSMTLDIGDMRAAKLGISSVGVADGFATARDVTDGTNNDKSERALDVSTHDSAANAVTVIQSAIDKVSAERSKLGANQNRLEHTINNLGTSSENLTAAESRIRDVDYVVAA